MKRTLLCLLLLFTPAFTLAACNSPAQPTEVPTEPPTEAPTEPLPTDPFTEAEYNAWFLGTALPVDGIYDAYDAHETEGTIYQRVFTQFSRPSDYVPQMEPQGLYRYDNFCTYTNEDQSVKRVYFRGHTTLSLFDNAGTDLPFPSNDLLVSVQDPAIFGLLEEFVFSQTFTQGGKGPAWNYLFTTFVTENLDGQVTTYTIFRDGTVLRNEDEEAVQKLDRRVTAAIFAVKHAYAGSTTRQEVYADAILDFDPEHTEFSWLQVLIEQNGKTLRLTPEESMAFLRMVSDPYVDYNQEIGYKCFLRSNCGIGERGEKLLDFSLVTVYADGRDDHSRGTYSLYEDGKVVYKDRYFMEYWGSHISILDQLLVDRYVISRSNFDTQAILDFLNS